MMAFARRRRTDWPSRWQELGKVAVDAAPALQRYYDTPLPDPTTELAQASLVALDLETTGLDARHDAIVSVGLLPFDLQRVRTSQARYWVVKPDTELAAESVTFHHLTHSDLAEAPPLSHILAQLLDALAGKVAVVHYRPIEREFLDRAARRLLGAPLRFPVLDTMQIEARAQRTSTNRFLNWVRGDRQLSLRLGDSRRRYHLPAYQAHHALMDALATAELLQAQAAHHGLAERTLASLWS